MFVSVEEIDSDEVVASSENEAVGELLGGEGVCSCGKGRYFV